MKVINLAKGTVLCQRNIFGPQTMFKKLYREQSFIDVWIASKHSPENKIAGHRVVLAAFSKFLYKKFIQDPSPAAVILIENVEEKFLNYFLELVYEGQVKIKQSDVEGFKQALRSLNVHGDSELRKFIYDEEDDEVSPYINEVEKLPSPSHPRALNRSSSSQISSCSTSSRSAQEVSKSPSPKSLEVISNNTNSVSSQLTHNSSNTSSAGDSSQIPRKRIRLYTNDSQDLEATEDKKPDVKPDVKSGQNQNRSFEEIVRLNSNVQFVQRVELNEIQRPIIVAPPPPQITLAPQPSPSIQRTLATSSSNLPPTQENREQAVKIENIDPQWSYNLVQRFLKKNKVHHRFELKKGFVLVYPPKENLQEIVQKFDNCTQGHRTLKANLEYI